MHLTPLYSHDVLFLSMLPVQDAEKYRSEDEEARKKIEAKNAVENYACVPHAYVPPVMDTIAPICFKTSLKLDCVGLQGALVHLWAYLLTHEGAGCCAGTT